MNLASFHGNLHLSGKITLCSSFLNQFSGFFFTFSSFLGQTYFPEPFHPFSTVSLS